MKRIETERLILRQFQANDFLEYAAMLSDQEVVKYIGKGNTFSRAESWRHVEMLMGHWQFRGYGLWVAEEKESNSFIGRIGLYNPEGWIGMEVGWMLVRSKWGKGYAFEGAKAAIDIAFNTMRVEKIISLIHPDNTRSIKLAEKLGEHFSEKVMVNGLEVLKYEIHNGNR